MLAFLGMVFPACLSEKIFIALYIFGMACSFRFLVKQLSPDNVWLSILIFPFIYTHLFCIGFYNYSISFIFFFLTVAYWIKTQKHRNFHHYLILFFLITLTYYSAALTYGFLGFTLGLLILCRWIKKYLHTKLIKQAINGALRELLILFTISLPTLVMLFLFYRSSNFPPPGDSIDSEELLNWINDGRVLIAYVFQSEVIYTRQFIHIILIIISFDLYQRYLKIKAGHAGSWLRSGDILLIPILLALLSFFLIPDDSGARMMSMRYLVLFFLLLIAWVASSGITKQVSQILAVAIFLLHFGLLFQHRTVIKNSIVPRAEAIQEAGNLIKPGSVILPVNLSDNWLELHFSNYLGVDNPIIILENYEASIGWFPIIWDKELLPDIQLGGQNSVNELLWIRNGESKEKKPIDYVFIYGNLLSFVDKKWDDLRLILQSDYQLVKISEERYYQIFERK